MGRLMGFIDISRCNQPAATTKNLTDEVDILSLCRSIEVRMGVLVVIGIKVKLGVY